MHILIMVECCQVAVSATDRSIDQSTPTECGVLNCVISSPQQRDGLGQSKGVAPHEKEIIMMKNATENTRFRGKQ
jgi:hypothetical protein